MTENSKTCFVVAPIGEEGSDTRIRSDDIYTYVISPAVAQRHYSPIRADEITRSGDINEQVIEHLLEDALVIADLTGQNPNVMYELAIRHVIKKPFIQIKSQGEKLPFDISALRTIDIDHRSLRSAHKAKDMIVKFIDEIETDPLSIATPISKAIDWERINKSENPEARQVAEMATALAQIGNQVGEIGHSVIVLRRELMMRNRSDALVGFPEAGIGAGLTRDYDRNMRNLRRRVINAERSLHQTEPRAANKLDEDEPDEDM